VPSKTSAPSRWLILLPFSFCKLPTGTTTDELVVSGLSVAIGSLGCVHSSAEAIDPATLIKNIAAVRNRIQLSLFRRGQKKGAAEAASERLKYDAVTLCRPIPWSIELGAGWAITGMETNFFTPSSEVAKYSNQSTFVIEREITERSFLFVEYVGDYPVHGGNSHMLNSGGGYRITDNQQIDFHIAFGLNRNAPTYIFGIGYPLDSTGFLTERAAHSSLNPA
jgi:hypothetical protein